MFNGVCTCPKCDAGQMSPFYCCPGRPEQVVVEVCAKGLVLVVDEITREPIEHFHVACALCGFQRIERCR